MTSCPVADQPLGYRLNGQDRNAHPRYSARARIPVQTCLKCPKNGGWEAPLRANDYRSCRNLVSMFFDEAARKGDRPFLWAKRDGSYRATSWREIAEAISALARGLRLLGIKPGERVGLVSENRPEWMIADLAIMAAGAITVPAY